MKDFRGKTAFITGAASGIGFALARAFGNAGANVVVADLDEKGANAAVTRLKEERITALALRCDVVERANMRAAAEEAVARFGKIHVLCNNAGVVVSGPVDAISERDWHWIMDVNVMGVVHGVETFLPLMRRHGEGGHIVNTASIAGLFSAPTNEPYAASKAAVVALSEGWAEQLKPIGIGVSVLCPGVVRTRIMEIGRARQDRYGGPMQGPAAPPHGISPEEAQRIFEQGLDPDRAAARVLEAVANGELYIFTHPEFRAMFEMRVARIRAGFDAAEKSVVLGRGAARP